MDRSLLRYKRENILCLVTMLLLALGTSAARADLEFKQPLADSGEVRAGVPLSHRFVFVNRGAESVEVTDTRASCGCLKPILAQRIYKPGEEGALDLEVHTLSQSAGPHTWRVQFCYRAGNTLYEIPL